MPMAMAMRKGVAMRMAQPKRMALREGSSGGVADWFIGSLAYTGEALAQGGRREF